MRKKIIIGLLFCYCLNLQGQDNNLLMQFPSAEQLCMLSNLKSDSLNYAQILEFRDTYKFSWLYLIPSVGYDFIANRPMITFNATPIVQHQLTKRTMNRRINSMNKVTDKQQDNTCSRIRTLHFNLMNKIANNKHQLELLSLDRQTFEIRKKQHENNEINLEEFITVQRNWINGKQRYISYIDDINYIIEQLEILCNTNLIKLNYDKNLLD